MNEDRIITKVIMKNEEKEEDRKPTHLTAVIHEARLFNQVLCSKAYEERKRWKPFNSKISQDFQNFKLNRKYCKGAFDDLKNIDGVDRTKMRLVTVKLVLCLKGRS